MSVLKSAFLDAEGRLFGKFNIIDILMTGFITLLVLGVWLVQSGWHQTSGQVIEGESDILISVQLSDLRTLDTQLFKPGETTAITIRNQPRGQVKIVDSHCDPLMVAVSGSAKPVPDPGKPNGYECFVTLKDHSLVTKDGYVSEGVKVKVGLGIELEGFKYRAYGRITDVVAVKPTAAVPPQPAAS